jgi:hypothetical protein
VLIRPNSRIFPAYKEFTEPMDRQREVLLRFNSGRIRGVLELILPLLHFSQEFALGPVQKRAVRTARPSTAASIPSTSRAD